MATMTDSAPTARLKTRYLEEIRPALVERFGYSSLMQAPKVEKVTINMGVGLAKQDSKMLKAATDQLATIAGQQPSIRRARKSIAAFKLREGMPVGVAVTLRAERSYEFLDRLISVAIPRIRDFRGLNPRSFDGRGNYSLGVKEQIIFPEIDYDKIDMVRGLDITITTSAASDSRPTRCCQRSACPSPPKVGPGAMTQTRTPPRNAPTRRPRRRAPLPLRSRRPRPPKAKPKPKRPQRPNRQRSPRISRRPRRLSPRRPQLKRRSSRRRRTASSRRPRRSSRRPFEEAVAEVAEIEVAAEAVAEEVEAEAAIVEEAEQREASVDGDTDTTEKESND